MAASKVAATNAAIINAVRNNASEQYRARIPEITDNNLTKTLALLQENSLLWNEFIQVLVQLGFQKALWCDEMNTSFVEVYVGIKTFSNYSIKMQKENTLTLSEVINRLYEEIQL